MHPAFQANLYADTLNLVELWLHSVLLHRGLYPPQAFHARTCWNHEAQVAKPGVVADYVKGFMRELEQQQLSRVSK